MSAVGEGPRGHFGALDRLRFFTRPGACLFILGHQRCYSSLLAHILGSSPEIAGYYEHQRAYGRFSDVWRLKYRLSCEFPAKKNRYWLDKILHDIYPIRSGLLSEPNHRVIFLLRRPEAVLRSILNMKKWIHGEEYQVGQSDLDRAVEHYTERLSTLKRQSREMSCPKIVLEAERLITEPEQVLDQLTRFLDLNLPLSRDYELFSRTGVGGYGDPSPWIARSRVVDSRQEYSSAGLVLPDLEGAYRDAIETIRRNVA